MADVEEAIADRERIENERTKAICDTLIAIAKGFAGVK